MKIWAQDFPCCKMRISFFSRESPRLQIFENPDPGLTLLKMGIFLLTRESPGFQLCEYLAPGLSLPEMRISEKVFRENKLYGSFVTLRLLNKNPVSGLGNMESGISLAKK